MIIRSAFVLAFVAQSFDMVVRFSVSRFCFQAFDLDAFSDTDVAAMMNALDSRVRSATPRSAGFSSFSILLHVVLAFAVPLRSDQIAATLVLSMKAPCAGPKSDSL